MPPENLPFQKETFFVFQLPSIIFSGFFLLFVLGGVESGMTPQWQFYLEVWSKGPTESARLWLDHLGDHPHYSTRTKARKNLPKLELGWDVTSC